MTKGAVRMAVCLPSRHLPMDKRGVAVASRPRRSETHTVPAINKRGRTLEPDIRCLRYISVRACILAAVRKLVYHAAKVTRVRSGIIALALSLPGGVLVTSRTPRRNALAATVPTTRTVSSTYLGTSSCGGIPRRSGFKRRCYIPQNCHLFWDFTVALAVSLLRAVALSRARWF